MAIDEPDPDGKVHVSLSGEQFELEAVALPIQRRARSAFPFGFHGRPMLTGRA
jgi:hypothetical protein